MAFWTGAGEPGHGGPSETLFGLQERVSVVRSDVPLVSLRNPALRNSAAQHCAGSLATCQQIAEQRNTPSPGGPNVEECAPDYKDNPCLGALKESVEELETSLVQATGPMPPC